MTAEGAGVRDGGSRAGPQGLWGSGCEMGCGEQGKDSGTCPGLQVRGQLSGEGEKAQGLE